MTRDTLSAIETLDGVDRCMCCDKPRFAQIAYCDNCGTTTRSYRDSFTEIVAVRFAGVLESMEAGFSGGMER